MVNKETPSSYTVPTATCVLAWTPLASTSEIPEKTLQLSPSPLATPATQNVVWSTTAAAEKAGTARRAQQMMAVPSDMDYDEMVRGHMLRDCSIAANDITNAKLLFGPNLHAIRGNPPGKAPIQQRRTTLRYQK